MSLDYGAQSRNAEPGARRRRQVAASGLPAASGAAHGRVLLVRRRPTLACRPRHRLRATAMGPTLAVLGAVAAGCGGQPSAGPLDGSGAATGPAEASAPGGCNTRLLAPAPLLDPAPAAEPVDSSLRLALSIDEARLRAELEGRVPRQLAAGGRSLGLAGRASYAVSRGDFALGLERGWLAVSTPVAVNVSVCKPLGSWCPRYGGCGASVLAVVRVPLALTPDGRLPPSRTSLELQRGCTIAGVRLSGRIRAEAERQLARVKRRIDSALAEGARAARGRWVESSGTLPLAGGGCLRLEGAKLLQAPARRSDGRIAAGLRAEGALRWAPDCPARGSSAALPAVETAPPGRVLAPSHLAVALPIGLEEVDDALSAALSGAKLPDAVLGAVRAQPTRYHGQPALALSVHLSGEVCGQTWLMVTPRYEAARRAIVLAEVRPWPGTALPPDELAPLVQQRAAIAAPAAAATLSTLATRLDDAVAAASKRLRPTGVELALHAGRARLSVEIARRGLRLVVRREAALVLRLSRRQAAPPR